MKSNPIAIKEFCAFYRAKNKGGGVEDWRSCVKHDQDFDMLLTDIRTYIREFNSKRVGIDSGVNRDDANELAIKFWVSLGLDLNRTGRL